MNSILSVVFFLLFIYFSTINMIIFVKSRMAREGDYVPSWVPILGGLFGMIALLMAPAQGVKPLWWLPLFVDIGCVPGLLFSLPYLFRDFIETAPFNLIRRFKNDNQSKCQVTLSLYKKNIFMLNQKYFYAQEELQKIVAEKGSAFTEGGTVGTWHEEEQGGLTLLANSGEKIVFDCRSADLQEIQCVVDEREALNVKDVSLKKI